MQFEIKFDGDITKSFMVREKGMGWFFPGLSKIQAEFLCEKLNELSEENEKLKEVVEDYKFQNGERHL